MLKTYVAVQTAASISLQMLIQFFELPIKQQPGNILLMYNAQMLEQSASDISRR